MQAQQEVGKENRMLALGRRDAYGVRRGNAVCFEDIGPDGKNRAFYGANHHCEGKFTSAALEDLRVYGGALGSLASILNRAGVSRVPRHVAGTHYKLEVNGGGGYAMVYGEDGGKLGNLITRDPTMFDWQLPSEKPGEEGGANVIIDAQAKIAGGRETPQFLAWLNQYIGEDGKVTLDDSTRTRIVKDNEECVKSDIIKYQGNEVGPNFAIPSAVYKKPEGIIPQSIANPIWGLGKDLVYNYKTKEINKSSIAFRNVEVQPMSREEIAERDATNARARTDELAAQVEKMLRFGCYPTEAKARAGMAASQKGLVGQGVIIKMAVRKIGLGKAPWCVVGENHPDFGGKVAVKPKRKSPTPPKPVRTMGDRFGGNLDEWYRANGGWR